MGMPTSEPERQAFLTALEAAVRERSELDALIEALARRAGVPVPEGSTSSSSGHSAPAAPDADPASLVADGEFFGQSATKAARAVLERLGRTRPLKTPEIYEAITKGGVKIKDMEVLYKSLQRSQVFLRVAKGTWGLSEWYPDRVRNAARKDALDDDGGDSADLNGAGASEPLPDEDQGDDA